MLVTIQQSVELLIRTTFVADNLIDGTHNNKLMVFLVVKSSTSTIYFIPADMARALATAKRSLDYIYEFQKKTKTKRQKEYKVLLF